MSWEDFKNIQQVINHANERFVIRPFVSQGDWDGRSLTVQVTDDGVVRKKPGLTLNLKWLNKTAYNQGLEPFECINEDDSIFKVIYPNNMMTPGVVEAQIQVLYKGNSTILKTFEITVQGDVNNPKAYINESSFGALEKALSTVNQYDTSIAELNDGKEDKIDADFRYNDLANKIETVSGGPIDTVTSYNELIGKYPSGAEGPVLVLESDGKTGYLYTWDGAKWKKGGIYQAQGVGIGTIKDPELAKEAVGPVKTNFIKTGKNKLNPAEIQHSGYHWNGTWNINTSYDSSGKIPVQPNQKWTVTYARFITFYDINYNYLEGISNSSESAFTYTVPPGGVYQEVCFGKVTKKMQIELGDKLTTYEPFEILMENGKISKANIKDFSVGNKDIELSSVNAEQTTFIDAGSNKFNRETKTEGYYVSPSNGDLLANAAYETSDFIAIEDGATLIQVNHSRFYAFYDGSGIFVSGGNGNTIGFSELVVPETAANFRTSHEKKYSETVQVNFSETPLAYEPYSKVLKGVKISADNIIDQNAMLNNAPKKMFATVGEENRIYTANLLKESTDVEVRYDVQYGSQMTDYFSWLPTNTGETAIKVQFFKNSELLSSPLITIKTNPMRTSKIDGGFLGDSTTNAGDETQRVIDKLGTNIELFGTRGTGANKHEGRGGWTFAMYRTGAEYAGQVNPFYDPVKKDFSFTYYAEQQQLPKLDFYFIQLGINDTFGYLDDESLDNKIQQIFKDAEYIINDIHAYDSTIKIGLAITFPPNASQDAFGTAKDVYQTQWRYKDNNFIWVQKLMEKYNDHEFVQLVPLHCVLDTVNNIDDHVHPEKPDGYYQLGDQVVAWLNSL